MARNKPNLESRLLGGANYSYETGQPRAPRRKGPAADRHSFRPQPLERRLSCLYAEYSYPPDREACV